MLRSDLCDFSDAYIVVKELFLLQNWKMQKEAKTLIMHHLSTEF